MGKSQKIDVFCVFILLYSKHNFEEMLVKVKSFM